ncbi:MAG: M20 family metallopeptidase [Bacteroidia bacterium]|nr:M20 family metallopeptidase [Bacteroidia bacterium]
MILLSLLITTVSAQGKKSVVKHIEKNQETYKEVAHKIWEYAEVGYQEEKSSALLKSQLEAAGFSIESGVAGIPTSFVATYGSGSPTIGILAEYDALPGISQDNVAERKVRVEGAAGHACGHHLFGTASVAAAIAVKDWLSKSKKSGTIKLFGTPAEEGGAGKVYMVREGLFEDIDAVLHWHPGQGNGASAASSLANKSAKFRFHGIASHAAGAPHFGRSALDGVEAMNYMVNLMREHVTSDTRIHYVITKGGEAPNVVPEFAEVFYYVRHPETEGSRETFERVVKAAEAAAMGTGTTMDYEVIHGLFNLMPNETLGRVVHGNMSEIGGFDYDADEMTFAEDIRESLPEKARKALTTTNVIEPFEVIERGRGGSTDVGDVSWVVPTAGLRTATWVPGTSAHTWQAVAAGGMSIGHKGMILAAKTIATSAVDLYNDPSIIQRANEELMRRRGADFKYEPLLGDRKPPLDYRK